ncbi:MULTISPECIES: HAMP domain-containing sensor histidine kinase [Mesorhizobium]|uniref:histidine kinase n=3 Tax=Mesorhizobium TaxID=68287 RepID=A0ABU5ARR9_9HYPH|nr:MULTISPECIES: HAMP domain-containing sensor histidine kinase [Mesorhizobium]MDX8432218.1 HAMP domain-containing sensor histidine kinase [Mesorhizobium abyssinicae]MDX8539978.1 HAMP domain-containing sensor histidine kinase [Mesorhizobium abyssinicae]RUW25590.1 HAMP domain-containing histidine kinase [Mesorhizobium sp. M4B.F.Ca.ET.013.02.1.1]RVD16357.1 HAMP domain-containing histidine kinase [Mesorhizobium sp. M4B.F.Ca.ET.017.02.2.1]RWC89826.1 MAG: HAMP domain-containing histidine kinase [Me
MTEAQATDDRAGAASTAARTVPLSRGLSTKLLLLTIVFVLLAEILIFLPWIASYRVSWLKERLGTAAAVSIVLVQGEPNSLSRTAQNDVLMAIGAKAIAVRDGGVSRLLVVSEMPPQVDEHIDISKVGMIDGMTGALDTLFFGGKRMLRVFGPVGESDKEFELIMPDYALRSAMLVYSRNVAFVSLLISLFTAMLVYAAIDLIMIGPIRTMTRSMLSFSEAPDDPGRIIRPAARADEIGVAERELSQMQERLQKMLSEQKHLADLGLAVSKINHDMRNILASAQLMSDRLRLVKDPTVQSFAPKLLRALDRAVSYSEGVLAYGRTQEPPPSRRRVRLRQLVEDVHGLLDIEEGIDFVNGVEHAFEVDADSDQLFRVLTNLCRNSVQAMAADTESAVVRRLAVSAERLGSVSRIVVTDTGPGLPPKARENLFAAFRGSARSGGTGLGLAIAYELIRAHGGTVELVESIGGRTTFAVTIPDQPVRLDQARGSLRRPA